MQGNNFDLEVVEEEGYSVDKVDEWVKSFFPNTIDMKPLQFVRSDRKKNEANSPLQITVVLSGGQAPGGKLSFDVSLTLATSLSLLFVLCHTRTLRHLWNF